MHKHHKLNLLTLFPKECWYNYEKRFTNEKQWEIEY